MATGTRAGTAFSIGVMLAATAALVLARPALAQSITEIGVLPGYDRTHVVGISGDGSIVAGYCGRVSLPGVRAFRWSQSEGLVDLGVPPGSGGEVQPTAISADGSTVVGFDGPMAWKWTLTAGFQTIAPSGVPNAGIASAYATAVNADGTLVVGGMSEYISGLLAHYAFSWTSAGPGTLLGSGQLRRIENSSEAYLVFDSVFLNPPKGISSDSFTVVGRGGSIVWHDLELWWEVGWEGSLLRDASASFHPVLPPPGESHVLVNALSADGTTAVGDSWPSNDAVRYTIAGGTQVLGRLPPETNPYGVHVVAVSADGGAVVGSGSTESGDGVAVLWTAATGMVDLNTYLPARGVDLAGAGLGTLWYARAISADGTSIAGETLDGARAWVARLPCLPPGLPGEPVAAFTCPDGDAIFSVTASGAGPFTYQWQRADPSFPGGWTDLGDGPLVLPSGPAATISGSLTDTLTLSGIQLNGEDFRDFRCVVSNTCGGVTSDAATLTVCLADYNCDTFVDGIDSDTFNNDFESNDPQQQMNADINHDGFVDGIDYDIFNNAFEAGC